MSDRISDAIRGLQGEAESLGSIQMAEFLQSEFDRIREELVWCEAERVVLNGDSCANNMAAGRGPCGVCKICLRTRAEKAEATVKELGLAIRSMVYWYEPDGVWRVGIMGDCQAPDEVQHVLANSEKED